MELGTDDPVFGPWLEMQSWGSISDAAFQKRRDDYLIQLSAELDAIGRTPDKLHALRGEPPKWNPFIVDALVEQKPNSQSEAACGLRESVCRTAASLAAIIAGSVQ